MSAAWLELEASKLLVALLRAHSPPGREEEALRTLEEWCASRGLDAWRDRAGNLHCSPPRAGRPVLMLVPHIDVIDDPLPVKVEGGVIYGRGAVDAKGPLASMAAAVAALSRADPESQVELVAVVGEEADSRGARALASARLPHVVVGEPTNADTIVIGYYGSAKAEVVCRSQVSHTARPLAEPATHALVGLLARLLSSPPPGARVTVVELEATPPTRSQTPPSARAALDVRVAPGFDPRGVVRSLLGLAGGSSCEVGVSEVTPPVRVRPSDPAPRSLQRALLTRGIKPRLAVKPGTSDMNLLAGSAASIAAYGPGDPKLAHTRSERVEVSQLGLAAAVYAEAYRQLASMVGGEELREGGGPAGI